MKLGVFGNFTDVKAPNLLLTDPDTGQPVALNFTTQTYDVDFSQLERPRGQEHPDLRRQLPPQQLQHHPHPERRRPQRVRRLLPGGVLHRPASACSVGARVDKFGNLDDAVFSPRISVMYKPGARHSIRLSYNRAFRSPSVVNNYLDQDIFRPHPHQPDAARRRRCPLPAAPRPRALPPAGQEQGEHGSQAGVARRLRAGLHGQRREHHLRIALYLNRQDDNINFVQLTSDHPVPPGPARPDLLLAHEPRHGHRGRQRQAPSP